MKSLQNGDYYKGYSENFLKRLEEHNRGESQYTRNNGPWKLVFVQSFGTKREALIQEKKLKRCNKEYLKWLINQPCNILKDFQ